MKFYTKDTDGHGVAILVETATDNHVRTVANVNPFLIKAVAPLATAAALAFSLRKWACFKLKTEGLNAEDLELELIDAGLDEMGEGTGENGETVLVLRCAFTDFGQPAEGAGRKRHHPHQLRTGMDTHHHRRTE